MKKSNRVQNRKLTKLSHRVLIWLASIAMTVYILWRSFFTIPGIEEYGMLAFVCGICLLAAEIERPDGAQITIVGHIGRAIYLELHKAVVGGEMIIRLAYVLVYIL